MNDMPETPVTLAELVAEGFGANLYHGPTIDGLADQLAARGVQVVRDNVGRRCVSRKDANALIAERAEAQERAAAIAAERTTHSSAVVSAVRTGITSLADALVSASVVLTAAIICAGAAGADPSQDDQFVALLAQDQIPVIDNLPDLVTRAHQICGELDGGASVKAVVREEMNGIFEANPEYHLVPGRVRRTAVRFVAVSTDVYCPSQLVNPR